ncbi:MAG: hypothetical protein RL757_2680 [Bacteroidota bacterium]|jgi:hypothetical protein
MPPPSIKSLLNHLFYGFRYKDTTFLSFSNIVIKYLKNLYFCNSKFYYSSHISFLSLQEIYLIINKKKYEITNCATD